MGFPVTDFQRRLLFPTSFIDFQISTTMKVDIAKEKINSEDKEDWRQTYRTPIVQLTLLYKPGELPERKRSAEDRVLYYSGTDQVSKLVSQLRNWLVARKLGNLVVFHNKTCNISRIYIFHLGIASRTQIIKVNSKS